MTEVTQQVIEDMARAVVKAVDPEKIVLFGSHARGDASPGSDVDLLVVEREPFGRARSRRKEAARIRRALTAFSHPVDVLVYATEEVDEGKGSPNHVIGRSAREGRLLYERPQARSQDA